MYKVLWLFDEKKHLGIRLSDVYMTSMLSPSFFFFPLGGMDEEEFNHKMCGIFSFCLCILAFNELRN